MSQLARTAMALPNRDPQRQGRDDRFRQRVIDRDALGNTPTIIGRDAAVEFCNDILGVPISFTRMRRGYERRELRVWKIGGVNATSPQALFDWVESMSRPVAGGQA